MRVGQQVVCVDDQFPKPLAKYYINLPTKDKTYTVRAVFVGRGVMHPGRESADGEIGLLLKELINDIDPRNKYKQELGFNSERFRPLRYIDARTDNEDELVRVRTAVKTDRAVERNTFTVSPNPQPKDLYVKCAFY